MRERKLRVGWLYGDIMNTYGDRGNILMLQYYARELNISIETLVYSLTSDASELLSYDIVCMGGAEDWQQEIVSKHLRGDSARILKQLIESNIPGIYICGAYQFLGRDYTTAQGTRIEGLGVFPAYTRAKKQNEDRLIGECVSLVHNKTLTPYIRKPDDAYLIGFENHGGRTVVSSQSDTVGKVVKGYGNNGTDMYEGCVVKSSIGTYFHGPLLARNPLIAEFLLDTALRNKYTQHEQCIISNKLVEKNRNYLLTHYNVKIKYQ